MGNKLREMSYNLNLGDDVLIHPQRALEPSVAHRYFDREKKLRETPLSKHQQNVQYHLGKLHEERSASA